MAVGARISGALAECTPCAIVGCSRDCYTGMWNVVVQEPMACQIRMFSGDRHVDECGTRSKACTGCGLRGGVGVMLEC